MRAPEAIDFEVVARPNTNPFAHAGVLLRARDGVTVVEASAKPILI